MPNRRTATIARISLLFSVLAVSQQSFAELTITSVTEADDTIELTVRNTDNFTVGALPYVLKIGDARFRRSRSPSDGALDTLIFLIPRDTFNQLNEGDLVDLGYGSVDDNLAAQASQISKNSNRTSANQQLQNQDQGLHSKRQWAMGRFNKKKLLSKQKRNKGDS